jgi:hypothetical protein
LPNILSKRMVTGFCRFFYALLVPACAGPLKYLIYQVQVLSGSLLFYQRLEEITKKLYVRMRNYFFKFQMHVTTQFFTLNIEFFCLSIFYLKHATIQTWKDFIKKKNLSAPRSPCRKRLNGYGSVIRIRTKKILRIQNTNVQKYL